MTRTLLIGSLVAFIPLSGLIAEEKPAPTLDLEARKVSVANLEIHIAQREQRLAEWGRDIAQLDARIEKQVEELVKMLVGLRDSQNSRTKVTQIKRSAIEGLKHGIDLYAKKRREIREIVRTGGDEALDDLGKLDQRILKRVDQIAELTKSIPTHDDVDKYQSDGGSYWDGYYNESSRASDEWKQNRRDTVQSNKQRDDTTKALKEALERLDQRRRALKDLLANRKITESARKLYITELGQIDAYEEHINAQLRDVTVSSGGGGRAVGREQANDIEALFEDARRDLREDVSRLFLTYDQYVRGRAYLEGLKENLAARKEWLEKNASGKSGTP
jgi:chromosome segregation ATPase